MGSDRLHPLAAGALVFGASAAVLILELLAARIVAPHVGASLETYSVIIGIVLAGIAAGSALGGKAADRLAPRALLGPVMIGGGALAALTLGLVDAFGDHAAGSPLGLVAVVLLSFFAPALLLSAVTPLVVKLQLRQLADTGSIVGRYGAIGTAGALCGSFATAFVLVEAAPVSRLVLGLGLSVIVAGTAANAALRQRRLVTVAGAGLAVAAVLVLAGQGQRCVVDNGYNCAEIVADPERPSGRLLVLDGAMHSYVDLDDPTYLGFPYMRTLAAAAEELSPSPARLEVLHVGGAGWTMPRYFEATRPGSVSTVLEIDGELVELAERQLGLERGPRMRAEIGDARHLLERHAGDGADLVIGDAFSGLTVPWQLTTVEAAEELKRMLRPEGLYLMNIVDGPPFAFLGAEAATLERVFDHVVVLVSGEHHRKALGPGEHNFIIAATDSASLAERLTADEAALSYRQLAELSVKAEPLTDDWAPVDQLRRAG